MTAPGLAGRWLLVTRVAWVMVVPFALKIFAVSIVGYWMELQRVRHEGARMCSDKGSSRERTWIKWRSSVPRCARTPHM